jgi:hypothetical protein
MGLPTQDLKEPQNLIFAEVNVLFIEMMAELK